MAFCSVLISVPVAFLTSVIWIILSGGSFLRFLLIYTVSAQIAFALAMLAFMIADLLKLQRDAMPRGGDKLGFDKLA